MKKTIVALAVAAFAATSANAATVFNQDGTKVDVNGSFRALLVKGKKWNEKKEELENRRADLGTGGSHFAFQASHNLGNGLSALGYAKVKLDTNTTLDTLYAGFKFDSVGQLTVGKQATNGDDLGLAGYSYDFGLGDNFVVSSGDKVVKFTSAEFEGFKFGLDYVLSNNSLKADPDSKDRTFVVSAFYDRKFGDVGFKFNAGYGHTKAYSYVSATDKTVKSDTTKAYTLATEVSYAPVAFAIDFSQEKMKNEKNVSLLFGAKYQVTDDLKLYANFLTAKHKEKNAETVKFRGYGLGVGYKLHKQVETFVETSRTRAKSGGESTTYDSKVQAGFRVHF